MSEGGVIADSRSQKRSVSLGVSQWPNGEKGGLGRQGMDRWAAVLAPLREPLAAVPTLLLAPPGRGTILRWGRSVPLPPPAARWVAR
jgi:hypothetical protein